ncbi:MAG: hypothetical protein ACLTSX_07440 [Collinsella sp.]
MGKTYAMLPGRARRRRRRGVDVVAGYIEPHERPRRAAPVAGHRAGAARMSIRAQRHRDSRNSTSDAALARAPRLILVDELAHTNAAGLPP